jgi:transcriptional regulator with XRE-family HTH domain
MCTKTISKNHDKRLRAIGAFIRELRYAEGLTQAEFSNQTNLHRKTIQRMEGGKNMTLLTIFELADAFDISPADIISIIV